MEFLDGALRDPYDEQARIARERFAEVENQYAQVARQYQVLADNLEKMDARWGTWLARSK